MTDSYYKLPEMIVPYNAAKHGVFCDAQTRKGLPARILCADFEGNNPVVVAASCDGQEALYRVRTDGRISEFVDSDLDVFVKEDPPKTYYLLVVAGMDTRAFDSEAEADFRGRQAAKQFKIIKVNEVGEKNVCCR